MADGQRVRWWQDEAEQTRTAREASERVAVAPSSLLPEAVAAYSETAVHGEPETDTWAELEAEAARRAAQAKTAEVKFLSFYTDKAAANARYRRYKWTVLPLVIGQMLFNYYIALRLPNPFVNITICIMPLLIFLYVRSRSEWVQKSTEPAVRLSPQGIHLCTTEHRNVMLPWNELVSAKLKGSGKYRHLELRGDKKRRFAIYEYNLPFTVEMLASHIADYRSRKAAANAVIS